MYYKLQISNKIFIPEFNLEINYKNVRNIGYLKKGTIKRTVLIIFLIKGNPILISFSSKYLKAENTRKVYKCRVCYK